MCWGFDLAAIGLDLEALNFLGNKGVSAKPPQKVKLFAVGPTATKQKARSRSSALSPLFWGEGSPAKIDYRKSWYPYSNLLILISSRGPRRG